GRRRVLGRVARRGGDGGRRVGLVDEPGVAGRRRVGVAGLVGGAHLEGVRAAGQRRQRLRRRAAAPVGLEARVETAFEAEAGVGGVVVGAGEGEGRRRVL